MAFLWLVIFEELFVFITSLYIILLHCYYYCCCFLILLSRLKKKNLSSSDHDAKFGDFKAIAKQYYDHIKVKVVDRHIYDIQENIESQNTH